MSWQGPMEPGLMCAGMATGGWGMEDGGEQTVTTINEVSIPKLIIYWVMSQKVQSVRDVAMLG